MFAFNGFPILAAHDLESLWQVPCPADRMSCAVLEEEEEERALVG